MPQTTPHTAGVPGLSATAEDGHGVHEPAPPPDPALAEVARRYPVAVTALMRREIGGAGPESDPLARQFLPDARELLVAPEELADPIGDEAHSPVKGIVHRYPDRVLLKPLHACAVYCRFCFRRDSVGPGAAALGARDIAAAIGYIRGRPEIWEVILTGGDPLLLSPRRLDVILSALDAIGHIAVIRLHSRIPVVDPGRISPAVIEVLASRRAAVYVAVHCNHPRELTPEAVAAARRMAESGLVLLGQSVLLKGVNDDVETLAALMRGLAAARIKPYYLHHPDLARGTAHFRVDIAAGQALVRALRGRLSGLCQPTYVLDLPGGHGKSPIGPDYLSQEPDGSYLVEDWQGSRHRYPPAPPATG